MQYLSVEHMVHTYSTDSNVLESLSFLLYIANLTLFVLLLVTVNVGRAGAANLDVIQEVEYVKQEAKVLYLLECLQKTPPPVSHVT